MNVRILAELKKTNREQDYAVIGELARIMTDVRDQLRYSRSARDLIALASEYPDRARELILERPLLEKVGDGRARLEEVLDAERRVLMHANEARLASYLEAAEPWSRIWPRVSSEVAGLSLLEAHEIVVERARGVLPFELQTGGRTGESPG